MQYPYILGVSATQKPSQKINVITTDCREQKWRLPYDLLYNIICYRPIGVARFGNNVSCTPIYTCLLVHLQQNIDLENLTKRERKQLLCYLCSLSCIIVAFEVNDYFCLSKPSE